MAGPGERRLLAAPAGGLAAILSPMVFDPRQNLLNPIAWIAFLLIVSFWAVCLAAPYGAWASDLGVTYANTGLPLQAVSGTPGAGQYAVAAGVYRFSAADAGASLSLSYGYVPQDLAQAAAELAAERFRAADRIGLRSKSLGGQETISYDLSGLSEGVATLIAPYKRTAL